jgi:hypothetical protein
MRQGLDNPATLLAAPLLNIKVPGGIHTYDVPFNEFVVASAAISKKP